MSTVATPIYQINDVVLEELLKLIRTFKIECSLSSLLRRFGSTVIKAIAIVLVKHYLSQTGSIVEGLQKLFRFVYRFVLYKKVKLCDRDLDPSSVTAEATKKYGCFQDEHEPSVLYVPHRHASGLEELVREAKLRKAEEQKHFAAVKNKRGRANFTKVVPSFSSNGASVIASQQMRSSVLFPSSNYRRLTKVIRRFFDVSTLTESNSVLGVLIDGEPGLGKSRFTDFIANQWICDVYRIDMTEHLETDFKDVVKCLIDPGCTSARLYMVDEIDKYLDYRLERKYKKHAVEREAKELEPVAKEMFVKAKKTKFAYQLLRILELDGLRNPRAFVFASNNFGSLFEGVDPMHVKSLLDRFTRIRFERCDADEVRELFSFYNDKMKSSEYWLDKEEMERVRDAVPDDTWIPYRSLMQVLIASHFDFREAADALRRWEDVKADDVLPLQSEPAPSNSVKLSKIKVKRTRKEAGEKSEKGSEKTVEDGKRVENERPKTPGTDDAYRAWLQKMFSPFVPSEAIEKLFPLYKFKERRSGDVSGVVSCCEYMSNQPCLTKAGVTCMIKAYLDLSNYDTSNNGSLFKSMSTPRLILFFETAPIDFVKTVSEKLVEYSKLRQDQYLSIRNDIQPLVCCLRERLDCLELP